MENGENNNTFSIFINEKRLFIEKSKGMKLNTNHPSFITFLDTVTNNVLTNISVEKYFTISPENKLGIQFMVLKLMKNSLRTKIVLSDDDMMGLITALLKKNVELENYELSNILKDMITNYSTLNDVIKPVKRITRKIKSVDSSNDEQIKNNPI
jgi:hypothetical protein